MSARGLRGSRPYQLLTWVQENYPWSLLWILFAVWLALIVTGLLVPAALVAMLFLVVLAHGLAEWRRKKRRDK